MSDHIIKAAKEAGIEFQDNRSITGKITTATYGSQPIKKMERFYAIAFAAGMERAAKVAEAYIAPGIGKEMAAGIRAEAHAQNQPKTSHDTGNVSKN